jgi:hypothetical protein
MLCAQLPTRLVSYDMDGAQLVERYCEKCFRKWEKIEKRKEHILSIKDEDIKRESKKETWLK